MGRRLNKRRKKEKVKNNLRKFILILLIVIVVYTGYGIYKERKIKLLNENQILIDKIGQTIEIIPTKTTLKEQVEKTYMGFDVTAKLTIPKINLDTYVLKDYTIEGMKICCSKYWGPEPNEVGNFCIAGHNYDKENMFNHLIDLEDGDELYLTDNKNGKCEYIIYQKYRVKPQNTAPIEQETNGNKIITLITCVNYSRSRLIIQAIQK